MSRSHPTATAVEKTKARLVEAPVDSREPVQILCDQGEGPYKVCTHLYKVAMLSEPISEYIPLQHFQRCSQLWCPSRAPQALRLRGRPHRERLQLYRAASSRHHTLASCYIHCPRVINDSHRTVKCQTSSVLTFMAMMLWASGGGGISRRAPYRP